MEEKYKESKPIILNKNVVAKINIFHRYDDIEDQWMYDTEYYVDTIYENSGKAAKEIVEQLYDLCSDSFLNALLLQGIQKLKDDKYIKYNFDELIIKINDIKNGKY